MPFAVGLLVALSPAVGLHAAIDAYLAGPVKSGAFAGVVLVAKDGKPVVRKAYGLADEAARTPHRPETRLRIFSVTKQFTAALVLRLQDQKKLSVDDPVSKYVAGWPAEWNAVTVHHLLNHSAGIDIDTLYFWLVEHHPGFWDDPATPPPAYEPKPLLDGPGHTFRYSNAGYTVLSLVAETAGGKPYRELLRDEVFTPLGLTATGFDGDRAAGYRLAGDKLEPSEQKVGGIVAAGDLISTVDDLLKLDEALGKDGFLSAEARKAVFTPRPLSGGKPGLAYGWSVRTLPDGATLHRFGGAGSGFTAAVLRLPEAHVYIAILSNREADGEFPYGPGVLERVRAALGKPAR